MGITQSVKQLKNSIIGAVNNAQLPACIVLLVMESLEAELRIQEAQQLQQEQENETVTEEPTDNS